MVLEVFYDGRRRAERVGAVPRLLRPAPRSAGGLPLGADRGQRGARVQQLRPDAVPAGGCASSSSTARRRPTTLYYQVDYTLQPELDRRARLPARRVPAREPDRRCGATSSSPRACEGPGRFLGCVIGVRVLDEGAWYGEGEVKVYRDGDDRAARPSAAPAWRTTSAAPGAWVPTPRPTAARRWSIGPGRRRRRWRRPRLRRLLPVARGRPDHVHAPICGSPSSRSAPPSSAAGQEAELAAYEQTHPVAGDGWHRDLAPGLLAWGIVERVDDYCATSFVYCARAPGGARRSTWTAAVADIERRPLRGGVALRAVGRVAPPDQAAVPPRS